MVLFQDNMDGGTATPLQAGATDSNATYTVVHDVASPFEPFFGTSGSSGYLNDRSTAVG